MSIWAGLAVAMAATVASGVGLVIQQLLNADLRVSLGSAAWAGLVSYIGGTICMIVFVLVMHDGVPSAAAIGRTNWFSWTGGFFGAVFIVVAILFIQRLGAATFFALLIAGQMLGSLLLDHYGALGVPQHPIDVPRLVGAALLVAGVFLIRL